MDAPRFVTPKTLPPFALGPELGRGGMGTVYRARVADENVAVKFLSIGAAATDDARARFAREARALAKVAHEGVVQLRESIEGDAPCLVLESARGRHLGKFFASGDAHSRANLRAIFQTLGEAVSALHRAGVVHCDLKPEHVILQERQTRRRTVRGGTRNPRGSRVGCKLIDFGIARLTEEEPLACDSIPVGTPAFMSPEQIRTPEHVGIEADLWAVSVMAYMAVTGRLPFTVSSLIGFLGHVDAGAWNLPSVVLPLLGTSFDQFFHRAFAANKDHRFTSINQLCAAFCTCLEATPTPAWNVSSVQAAVVARTGTLRTELAATKVEGTLHVARTGQVKQGSRCATSSDSAFRSQVRVKIVSRTQSSGRHDRFGASSTHFLEAAQNPRFVHSPPAWMRDARLRDARSWVDARRHHRTASQLSSGHAKTPC